MSLKITSGSVGGSISPSGIGRDRSEHQVAKLRCCGDGVFERREIVQMPDDGWIVFGAAALAHALSLSAAVSMTSMQGKAGTSGGRRSAATSERIGRSIGSSAGARNDISMRIRGRSPCPTPNCAAYARLKRAKVEVLHLRDRISPYDGVIPSLHCLLKEREKNWSLMRKIVRWAHLWAI